MAFPKEAFLEQANLKNRSPEFIKATSEYIDKLSDGNFPILFSIPHFAIELGMESDFIAFLIESRNFHYSSKNYSYSFFLLRKKNKKNAAREIMAPKEHLKYLQRWINFNILQKANYNSAIQGFVPGTSTYKNAQIHQGAKFLLKIDLLKFFDCIDEFRVYKVFRMLGYAKNLAWDFAKLCTARHRPSYWESFSADHYETMKEYISKNPFILPQGAPTSPLLANLVASNLDRRLQELSKKQNFAYSRYADDLCFSSNEKENIPSVKFLLKIIEEEGFFINHEKTLFLKKGMKQYVTGLSITNGISIKKEARRKIFSHLYFLKKYGVEAHIVKLNEKGKIKENFQNWLLGNISYHYSINKEIGSKMFELYNKINWVLDSNFENMPKPQ